MPGRLVVLCGLPGSGKTTLARRMVEVGGPATVRLCPDDELTEHGLDLWDGDARAAVERELWELAQRYLHENCTVVVEFGGWQRAERDALRDGARAIGAVVELRFLDEPLDVLWARVRGRGDDGHLLWRPLTRADLEDFERVFERPTAEELATWDHVPSRGLAQEACGARSAVSPWRRPRWGRRRG